MSERPTALFGKVYGSGELLSDDEAIARLTGSRDDVEAPDPGALAAALEAALASGERVEDVLAGLPPRALDLLQRAHEGELRDPPRAATEPERDERAL
jgi:hypothetical protein